MTEPRFRRRAGRLAVQLVGFVACLGLLAWAVSIALKPQNRDQLDRLADASAAQVAWLLGLSALTIVLNGLTFWAVLAPARRLNPLDVIAVSTIANFLAYLPFKLSVVARAAIHNRRDKVPLLTIGAWILAFTALIGVALTPPIVASIVRQSIDAIWLAIGVGGVVVCTALTVLIGRHYAHDPGLERLHRLIDPITPRRLRHLVRSAWFRELHEGFAMLADARTVSAAVALRLADVIVQAARFAIAARVLGVALTPSEAVLFAMTYFLIGAMSPFGFLGVREMGTTAVASIAAVAASEEFVGVTLLVTGADSIVSLTCAAAGIAWLRPDRLFRNRRSGESA